MESSGLLGAALRRWYVTLLGLLLTAGLCLVAVLFVPAKYESTARVLLLPPQSSVGKGGNVYLALGGLDSAVAILGQTMSDADADAALKAKGATAKFTIAPDALTSAPVLYVVADDKTATASMDSLDLALAMVPTTLDSLQKSAEVPANSYISASVITQDQKASVVRKTQIRALVVALGAGLALTLVLVALVDRRMRRRTQRRSQRGHGDQLTLGGEEDGPGAPPDGAPRGSNRQLAPSEWSSIGEETTSSQGEQPPEASRALALTLAPLGDSAADSRPSSIGTDED